MNNVPASRRNTGLALVPALRRMEIRLPVDSFLLSRFEEFYRELAQLKLELAAQSRRAGAAAHKSQQRLAALLLRQESEVARTGTLLGVEMYRQAKRVMAALADETLGRYSWPADSQWPSLEADLFQGEPGGLSRGGQCLKKLDQLLRQDDPVYRELAVVYFYALALGRTGQPETANYLTTLSKTISSSLESSHLFPQSYAHTLAENKMIVLPSPRKWILVGTSILLTWVALSWVLWTQVSLPIKKQLNEIQEILRP